MDIYIGPHIIYYVLDMVLRKRDFTEIERNKLTMKAPPLRYSALLSLLVVSLLIIMGSK